MAWAAADLVESRRSKADCASSHRDLDITRDQVLQILKRLLLQRWRGGSPAARRAEKRCPLVTGTVMLTPTAEYWFVNPA